MKLAFASLLAGAAAFAPAAHTSRSATTLLHESKVRWNFLSLEIFY
jgi:hypothetical protein